jgi:hypothetical protein
MLIILQEVHSRGFHDINAVVSLPFLCFYSYQKQESDFIIKREIFVPVRTAVERKLMVLSSQNTLKTSVLIKKRKRRKKLFSA